MKTDPFSEHSLWTLSIYPAVDEGTVFKEHTVHKIFVFR